jgi:hypothetical protein
VYRAVKDAKSASKAISEALNDLLKIIEQFLKRLDIYSRLAPTGAMDEVILELLVELLFALALLTKVINQNRQSMCMSCSPIRQSTNRHTAKFTKRLRGENEAEAAEVVRRLDRLTQNETQMAAAQTLEIVDGLVKDVKVVIDGEKVHLYFRLLVVERPVVAKTSVDLIHDIQIEANKSKRQQFFKLLVAIPNIEFVSQVRSCSKTFEVGSLPLTPGKITTS